MVSELSLLVQCQFMSVSGGEFLSLLDTGFLAIFSLAHQGTVKRLRNELLLSFLCLSVSLKPCRACDYTHLEMEVDKGDHCPSSQADGPANEVGILETLLPTSGGAEVIMKVMMAHLLHPESYSVLAVLTGGHLLIAYDPPRTHYQLQSGSFTGPWPLCAKTDSGWKQARCLQPKMAWQSVCDMACGRCWVKTHHMC